MNLEKSNIIFYDGQCALCNRFVKFVIKRDKYKLYKYAPLQGNTFKKLFNGTNSKLIPNTVILFENGRTYFKSTAALKIIKNLKQPWPLLYSLIIIPAFLRNFTYNIVAKYRYAWFGKSETCWLTDIEYKDLFLD